MTDVETYQSLITSEHRDKPNFMAMIAATVQPFVDAIAVINQLPQDFDLDTAIGVQLDTVGLWIGQSRKLEIPIPNVWFSFDIAGQGFDEGYWYTNGEASTSVMDVLPDEPYRTLLYAKVADNNWDGSIPHGIDLLSMVLPGDTIIIQDNQDMSMFIGVSGHPLTDAVQTALLENGYLNVKPVGVRVAGYVSPSVDGPLFGFDAENNAISGFDVGAWALITEGV